MNRVALRRGLDRWGDLALAALLGAGLAAQIASLSTRHGPLPAILGAALGLVLAARRRVPVLVAVLVLLGIAALNALVPGIVGRAVLTLAVFLVAMYSLGRHARGVAAWAGPPIVVAAVVVLDLGDGDASASGIFFYLLVAGLPWAAGVAVLLRVDRVREQRERNARLEEDARRAVAAERDRIAFELHDVVSHAIAVTVLQARRARTLVGLDDDALRASLTAIERTNTAALADMRRLLALLRDTETAELEPMPTLDRLDDLIERMAAAGLAVEVERRGTSVPLTPGLELSAFRILEETVTEAAAHGLVRVRIEIRFEDDGLLLLLPGAAGPAMRERAATAGGSVVPVSDGAAVRLPYLAGALLP